MLYASLLSRELCQNEIPRKSHNMTRSSSVLGASPYWRRIILRFISCLSRVHLSHNKQDFNILNQVTHYECPESGFRIIVSNGIPDHDIMVGNPNPPCVQNWFTQLPLVPSFNTDGVVEPAPLGFMGMSLNGVPVYGAQEGGGTNAVEAVDGSLRVPYFGHAARQGDWHYHSGEFGRTPDLDLGEITAKDLLGYAADGYPIYGPLEDSSILDECNGVQMGDTEDTYQYHVRLFADVDETADYCDGDSPVIVWKYVLGCLKGDLTSTLIADASVTAVPEDCVLTRDKKKGSRKKGKKKGKKKKKNMKKKSKKMY